MTQKLGRARNVEKYGPVGIRDQLAIDILAPSGKVEDRYKSFLTIWIETPIERIRLNIDQGRITIARGPELAPIGPFTDPFFIAEQEAESKRIGRFEVND